MSALDSQVGGGHYAKLKIQPMVFAMNFELNALEFSALKYLTRYQKKNGLEDLKKARHCVEMLQEIGLINKYKIAKMWTFAGHYCVLNGLSEKQTGAIVAVLLFNLDDAIAKIDILIQEWQ